MENLSLYLLMLLAGIIIGGVLVGALLAPLTPPRLPGYQFPAYAGAYEYSGYSARRPAALPISILFLLLLLALIFLGLRRERKSTPVYQDRIEQISHYGSSETARML